MPEKCRTMPEKIKPARRIRPSATATRGARGLCRCVRVCLRWKSAWPAPVRQGLPALEKGQRLPMHWLFCAERLQAILPSSMRTPVFSAMKGTVSRMAR